MLGYGVVLFGILKRPKKEASIQNADNLAEGMGSEEILDDKGKKQ